MIKKLICMLLFPVILFMGCNIENEKTVKSAYTVLCDDWVYYTVPGAYGAFERYDLSRMYKIRLDGTGLAALNNENTVSLIAYGDWIYFISGEQIVSGDYISSNNIYRIRKDGTGREKIIDVNNAGYSWPMPYCSQFWIVNDQIIFQDWSREGGSHPRICRADMNGENRQVIYEEHVREISDVADGWIYFYNFVEGKGDESVDSDEKYKIRLNGTRKTKVSGYEELDFVMEQGKAYYIESEKLFCTDIKMNQTIQLADNAESFCIHDGVLFYATREDGILKAALDGSGKTKIFAYPANYMDIVGDWIYAQIILDESREKYIKLKIDGSDFLEIDNVFDERAYKDRAYYYKLYQNFQCVQSSGGFQYPKMWQLSGEFYDTIIYRDGGTLPDEREFSDYGNNCAGHFSFKHKNLTDNNAHVNYIWLEFDHKYTDKKIPFVTNEGKKGAYEFGKTDWGDPAFYAHISDDQMDFNFSISFRDKEDMEKYHNILIDMMKTVKLKASKEENN